MITCLAAISSSRPSPITTYVTFFPNLDTILSKQLSLPDERKQFLLGHSVLLLFNTKEKAAARFTSLCVDRVRGSLLGEEERRQLEMPAGSLDLQKGG